MVLHLQFSTASDTRALLLPLPQCAPAPQLSSSCVQKAVPRVCVLLPVPSARLASFADGVSLDPCSAYSQVFISHKVMSGSFRDNSIFEYKSTSKRTSKCGYRFCSLSSFRVSDHCFPGGCRLGRRRGMLTSFPGTSLGQLGWWRAIHVWVRQRRFQIAF